MDEGETAGWIRFDDVEIDLDGHRLRVGGTEVPLEPKAFAVLALLARHPGHVLARDQILDAVWGHAHVTPGVLNRIITLLRQALGESAGTQRYLHTVHGVGYRLDLPAESLSTSSVAVSPVPGATESPERATPPAAVHAGERAVLKRPDRRLRAVLWAAPLLVLLAFAGWKLWPGAPEVGAEAVSPAADIGIAVLPLANAGGDPEQQFFSDGLSQNLITTLSQYEELRVIASSSSFRFRDSKEDSRAIGAALGVSHLIDGSVQRVGDDVRIAIELVRTVDGSTVWSQRYERPYADLFALQDEIALAVVGALQIKLLHIMPGAVNPGRPASGNLDAYNAYLRGTYYMGAGGDARKAIEYFAEATRLDPDYAQAWSWLGFVRTQHARGALAGDAARAAYAQAQRDNDVALRLQPDNGQAHAIRANLLATGDHDWNAALDEFRIALSLVSDTDPTHGAVSRLLATLGRINESIEERKKYIAGDPLAAFARVYLAELQASLGRLDEAEANLRGAEELQPELVDWYASERSYLAILRGDAATALAEAGRMSPGRWQDYARALALQVGDDRVAADAALKRLVDIDGQAKGSAYELARIHALRGDADETFAWLRRDWDRGEDGVLSVLYEPLLLRFRDDPRFAAYCTLTGLPPPERSEALALDRIRATAKR